MNGLFYFILWWDGRNGFVVKQISPAIEANYFAA